jgi:hypothetical protein
MKPWEASFGAEKAPWEEEYLQPKLKKGLLAAGERGTRGLLGSLQTGFESLSTDPNAAANAAIKGVQRQEQLAQEIEAPASLEKVKEAYRKKGILSAAGEVASQIPGAIVEQVPQIGAMIAGAKLGSIGGPWGALIGAAAVPLAQFYGSNLQRQAAEQINTGTPVDVDRGKAALAAAPQAALDLVQQRLLFGSKLFSKALGIPEATLVKQSAEQVEKLAQEKLLPTLLKGTAKGVAAEIPTEIGQQMIERAQADLSITSPEALAEYGETAYQVGLLGPLGAVGRISDKGAARAQVAGKEAADAAILADQQRQLAPVTPGAPIATPPATVPTLFEPTELPAQLTPDEIAGTTLKGKPVVTEALPLEQQKISELERNIEALVQQNTPEALAQAETLKQQLPESLQAKTFRLGEEMMQLERKRKELETQREEIKKLDDKNVLTQQMKQIDARQQEVLQEGKFLEREGVDLEPAEGLFTVEGKRKPQVAEQTELNLENVVTEDAFKEMGIGSTNKRLREAILGKNLSDPAEHAFVIKALDAFAEAQQGRSDMSTRVAKYARKLEQEAPSEPGTIYDVGAGANIPGLPLPSGQPGTTPGITTPATTGLAGAVPAVGGPTTGTGTVDQTGPSTLTPTPKIEGELRGKATPKLLELITKGDLKGALQEIANGKQFTQLDNLVAKRLLQAKTLPKVEIVSLEVTKGYPAQYDPNTDTVQITAGNIDSHTVLHEAVHGFLHAMIRNSEARQARGLSGLPKLKNLEDIYKHVQKNRPDLAEKYGMKDLSEFASEAMSNPDFQNDLRNTPYRRTNVFTEFGKSVLRLMGINLDQSNIADIDSLTAALISAEDAMTIGRKMQEDVQGGVRQQGELDIAQVARTPQGSQAEADMLAFGGRAEPKEQSFIDKQKDKFNTSKAKWQESYELNNDWVSATFGKMQNIASFDQAFNNRLYNHFNNLKKQGVMTMPQVESALIRISISQAVHRGNLANQIIDRGSYSYDAVTNRWSSVEDPVNMKAFEGLIRSLATKLGVDPNRARQIMGAAYEANRLQSMYQDLSTAEKELVTAEKQIKDIENVKQSAQGIKARQQALDNDRAIAALLRKKKRTAGEDTTLSKLQNEQKSIRNINGTLNTKRQLINALQEKVRELTEKVQHKNPAQVEAGMRLYNSHLEIQEGTKVWNTMRERVVKMLVETGVKTEKQAEAWLDEAAYVPFFRDMEEEKAIGPQIMSRGMRESMKDYGMKGSMRDVNDPIENMYQWMQWSIARAISNKQLQVMLDSYKDALPSEVRDGKGVNGKTFSIYRDGVQRFYNVDDAAVAQAFMGLEPVVFPAIKYFANTSNFLRHAVTRMPLFPVVQLFNDSYNAMFVSGLKNPFGLLKEIAKEVVATAKGTSETRNTLIQAGILETQDYNALNEAEAIGQRLNLNEPGAWRKLARNLDRFSSASDNVIRQGIYNQSRKEGLSHEAAMEKAAEVVNFRRISSNETMQLLSRIVPFFNAYTQVASVAVKTLTGRGISPQERDVATKTLIATTTKIMLLSMMYSMAVGDDEDYQKKNRVSRDRMFMIPGSGGFGIPIRMDAFAIPKLAGEYGYQLMSDSMFTDAKMFRESMARAIKGSIMPPSEGVPQLIRPALGVIMNYDAFQDREIINATMRRLDPDRQYTKTTSEMAKALGAMSGISPLNIDFLLRGYLGSVATLTSLATNDAINAVRGGPPRPDRSVGDIISSLPNMGAMMSREENTAVLSDFYEVARDVNKAVDTLGSMKYASPEAKQAYREENKKELALKGQVQAINKQLTVLRRREQMIREAPEERMGAEQKQTELKRIDELRSRMTQNVMRIRQKLYE